MEPDFTIIETAWGDQDAMIHIKHDGDEFKAAARALATLPEQQSATLRRRYYRGQTLDEIATAEGVYKETVRQWQEKGLRALRRPRVRRELDQFVEDRTPYFGNWGARTGERTTEMIVLKREDLRKSEISHGI